MESEAKPLKPLNLNKLRKDLQLIMDEIDRTQGVLPDYYSPVMWRRLQETAEKVANAIEAVRMKLSGKSVADIAEELSLTTQTIAGYLAWNTMYDPDWIKPQIAKQHTICPVCNAPAGFDCPTPRRIHKGRIEAFRNSTQGRLYLQHKAKVMTERYGVQKAAGAGQ